MLFSSISFLFYFLPIVLILYCVVPQKIKNYVLLLASLVFYAWGEPKYIILLIISILAGYGFGLLINKYRGQRRAKVFTIISVTFSLALLVYFKYADFFITTFNLATGLSLSLLKIALPIGISFYTFQIISYTIDVYRGEVEVQKKPLYLATYVAMFPQLIAGPIVRYADVAQQIEQREHSLAKTAQGTRRFILGLAKKVLIANTLGELVTIIQVSGDKSVLFYWLYALAFTLQIYFDFSGYSDMAIGLGKVFGFDFKENFNYPYIAKSITDFWRRWHISLSSWFKDYVYIPLGGNKGSPLKWLRNIIIVWMLTGLWHGAAWNFVLWGLFFVVFIILEKYVIGKYLEKSKVFSHLYVMFLIMISFVIFNASSLSEMVVYLESMFGLKGLPLISHEFIYYLKSNGVLLLVALIGATSLVPKIVNKLKEKVKGRKVMQLVEPIILVSLLSVVVAFLIDGSFNPFLYFRF